MRGRSVRGFNPTDVTAIRNGYYWIPAGSSGLGTTGFTWSDQNRHTAADVVQDTLSKQPSVISGNGNSQFRFTAAADTRVKTAGNLTAGWSGNTYLALWYRMPNGTPANGTTGIFVHQTTGNLRLVLVSNGTTNAFLLQLSNDGTSTQSDTWADPTDGNWYWLEFLFTASVGVDHYRNGSLITHASQAINKASINDQAIPLAIGSLTSVASFNQNDCDVGPVYYGNGLPTAAERALLARHASPIAVSF